MKNSIKTGMTSVFALALISSAAMAQTTLTGVDALDDRIDDIETAVQDEFERSDDTNRFGATETRQGFSGSASVGYSGKSGENDIQDLSIAARMRYAQGQFVHTLGFVLDYAEAEGNRTKEDTFGVYDANYYVSEKVYGFVLGRVKVDGLAVLPGDIDTDAFIGVGPGYRIVNTPDLAWRVQAGLGQSYIKYGDGNSQSELGYIASSRFYWKLSESMFATLDTDVLNSDTALRINNDFGVNFRISDAISTRVSYLTEYNDNRDTRTENKLGVALVFGF
ncbi:MAG: DUF481 domain-containing protein [Paracoccaceae bacterium]|nr:DUF481 domain-containing protein [Paracoccaceae bacterium]